MSTEAALGWLALNVPKDCLCVGYGYGVDKESSTVTTRRRRLALEPCGSWRSFLTLESGGSFKLEGNCHPPEGWTMARLESGDVE
jgi:hypothetical protein